VATQFFDAKRKNNSGTASLMFFRLAVVLRTEVITRFRLRLQLKQRSGAKQKRANIHNVGDYA